MAEFVMKHLVKKAGRDGDFFIDSKATSTEEIGNPPHPGTLRKMQQVGIPVCSHRASQLKKSDYDDFDFILGMDSWNIRNILRITGGDPENKVHMLLDYTDHPRDIADPWYTGNFEITYNDIIEGCNCFLNKIRSELNDR